MRLETVPKIKKSLISLPKKLLSSRAVAFLGRPARGFREALVNHTGMQQTLTLQQLTPQ
jgi:hypothetical protein